MTAADLDLDRFIAQATAWQARTQALHPDLVALQLAHALQEAYVEGAATALRTLQIARTQAKQGIADVLDAHRARVARRKP